MFVVRLHLAFGLVVMMALAPFSLGQPATPVLAHGVVDQANEERVLGPGDVRSSSVNTITDRELLGQEFTPSAISVVAVDLRLVPVMEPHASLITVRIRQGPGEQCRMGESGLLECPAGFKGAIFAETTPDVTEADGWVHFDFPSAAVVVPGDVYLITAQSNNYGHGWWRDEGNRYTGGMAAPGFPGDGTDFLFRTYAAPEPTPVTETPPPPDTPQATPSPVDTPTPTASPTASPPVTPTAALTAAAPQSNPCASAFSSARPTTTTTLSPVATPAPNSPSASQTSGPVPSPSPTPLECGEVDTDSGSGLTAQAAGLSALGVLTAGSALALSVAAVRRRRS